jgi:ABC-type amino acid transport substrate-binding protein
MASIPRSPVAKSSLRRALRWVAIVVLIAALSGQVFAVRDVNVALTELSPSLFTDEQGKPAGFFVDIIDEVARKEGWHVVWVSGSLSESWQRLDSGEIDLLPGVASTPEREVLYAFSNESALSVWSQVYARPGSGINTILDLEGKQVAMVRGDSSGIGFRQYARAFNVNCSYIEKENPDLVFTAVEEGKADALVVYNIARLGEGPAYRVVDTPVMFNPVQLGFAVKKGKNQDLLLAIDRSISAGKSDPSSTYRLSSQKWYGVKTSATTPSWIWWGLGGIAALAALFVFTSIVLRVEVRRKTAEIAQRNEELQSEVVNRSRAEAELVQKNEELRAAYAQLTIKRDELRENLQELKKSDRALLQAREKLNLLNTLTFQDIQNGLFSLIGYLQLALDAGASKDAQDLLKRAGVVLQSVQTSLAFAQKYQSLGINQALWQNVKYVFISALSHLDLSEVSRTVDLPELEIYADPLLEDVFMALMKTIYHPDSGVTRVNLRCRQVADHITILIEGDGPGLPAADKEKVFTRDHSKKDGLNLFLAREILSITDIGLDETAEPGQGIRFEIRVPLERYRIGTPPSADRGPS